MSLRPKTLLRCDGYIICILSAASIGLGIADIVNNYYTVYCKGGPGTCLPMTTDQALTWVGVGIWAAIPIFLTGLDSIHISTNPKSKARRVRLAHTGWVSSYVFSFALMVVSCVEIGYKFSSGLTPATLGTPSQIACFAVPMTIAGIGLLLHMCTLLLFIYTREARAVVDYQDELKKPKPSPPRVPEPERPTPIALPQCPAHQEHNCTADAERLNVWAATRWTNYQQGAPVVPLARPALASGNASAGLYQTPRVMLAGTGASIPTRW